MKVKYVLTILLFVPMLIFAQGEELPSIDLSAYVSSFAIFVTTVMILVQTIKERLAVKKTALVIISWSLGLILAAGAYFLKLGFFASLDLIEALVYGIGGSLASNGIISVGKVQMLISFAIRLIPKKKK